MSGIQNPELRSIAQQFSGTTRLKVPKYQRNFAWKLDETEELWEDLQGAVITRRTDYFLGTIVLQETEDPQLFEIIDGQQRMTCITMMFSAIRNVFLVANDSRAADILKDFIGTKWGWSGQQRQPPSKGSPKACQRSSRNSTSTTSSTGVSPKTKRRLAFWQRSFFPQRFVAERTSM